MNVRLLCTAIVLMAWATGLAQPQLHSFASDGFLKAVELDPGDTLRYPLRNGQVREFVLQRTAARPIFSWDNPDNKWRSGRIYQMEAELLCDGQPLRLQRIVSAQQSYYEPYHLNGVTVFFDAVSDIKAFIQDNHGSSGSRSFPRKKCRLAFIEMGDAFASQPLRPWLPLAENYLDVTQSYEGADTWSALLDPSIR